MPQHPLHGACVVVVGLCRMVVCVLEATVPDRVAVTAPSAVDVPVAATADGNSMGVGCGWCR